MNEDWRTNARARARAIESRNFFLSSSFLARSRSPSDLAENQEKLTNGFHVPTVATGVQEKRGKGINRYLHIWVHRASSKEDAQLNNCFN